MSIRNEQMTNITTASPPEQEGQGEVGFPPRTRKMSMTITAKPSRGRQTLLFLRHFGEMVLAMMVGMLVFGIVNGAILVPMGFPYLSASFPEAYSLAMAFSMIVPTALLIAVCSLGLLPHTVLIPGTHILMLPAMLGVMLYRWRDYTCH